MLLYINTNIAKEFNKETDVCYIQKLGNKEHLSQAYFVLASYTVHMD